MRLHLAAAILPLAWQAVGLAAQELPGAPRLGIGPGRELLLLGDDEPSTALAMRWAERLDIAEAAYRRSSPELGDDERHGRLEVGHAGRCRITSVPVDGEAEGWSSLRTEHDVVIPRFQRFLDGDGDCGGPYGLDLSLFPAPWEEAFDPPYDVTWPDVELPRLGFLDLEPTPRTPAVRTLARHPATAATAREAINIATWPAAGDHGVDLCRAPFMDTLCLKDLRIREQLATAATTDPAVAGPITRGCRDFFDRLPSVPSPHPCTDRHAWRRVIGTYLTGYTGELLLRDRPRLISRTDASGDVQWLWSEAGTPARTARFVLADGTGIELGLPRTAPHRIAPVPAQTRPAPRPARARMTPPPPATRPPDPRPPATTTRPPPPGVAIESPPSPSMPPPSTATTVDPTPAPRRASVATPLPATTESQTPPEEPPAGDASDTGSIDLSGLGSGLPSSAMAQPLLWPIVLTALATITLVALLLRGSTRKRHRVLHPEVVPRPATPDLLLEVETSGERLLAGRDDAETSTARLLLGPVPDADPAPAEVEPDPPEVEMEPPAEDTPAESGDTRLRARASRLALAPKPEPAAATATAKTGDVLPLEPPELSDPPVVPDSHWGRLEQQWHALENGERQGVHRSLTAITRLGDWVSCLLPVLDQIEHGQGDLPPLDRLPAPAQREWRDSRQALREFANLDAIVFHRLERQLTGPISGASDDGSAETQYLEDAGLLDPERGSLAKRLRRHLLRPGAGRFQKLALALQYLIEAFPVEHLEPSERKAYLGAVRERLEAKGLSTKFHRLIGDLASGLGLSYRQARYYKTRVGEGDRHEAVNLSERVGYPAATDRKVVVRLAELFLSGSAGGEHDSGRALVDGGS